METETQTAPKPPKAKRKKSTTPRAPRVKDEGILAIEKEAADKKAQYRLSQQSGGILKRILKLVERLAPTDRQKLYDSLSATETPALTSDDTLKGTPEMPSAGHGPNPAGVCGLT